MIYSGEKLGKRRKISCCARFIHLAFFASIFTQLWHLGQWTFTGLFDLCRLASRIPMYVHSWLQWWQVTLQLEYWDYIHLQAEIVGINSLQAKGESAIMESHRLAVLSCMFDDVAWLKALLRGCCRQMDHVPLENLWKISRRETGMVGNWE